MDTTKTVNPPQNYWGKLFGIEKFKLEWHAKRLLYKLFGISLPKLADQRDYWQRRGEVYFEEISASGYLDREIFFQDMLVNALSKVKFSSFFEAGCGFGWNIGRVKRDFSDTFVGGVDFSLPQLRNSRRYLEGMDIPVANADACKMPLADNAFDVGFSLGVFMNIHPDKIRLALSEMLRVCGKYIIHIEYDQNQTTPELREKRAFKTNIVSHDYASLYRELGAEVMEFKTYTDFGEAYYEHARKVNSDLDRWEGFEGPEKYIFIVVKV
ncbi:class I SAM-dependent methyltransferase [Salidesulfovibrio onnuriiensis]|uniref:class I SAM-dependent methyltransferase n=1 Tax=Salidesulfovibrio onnuriiensis TaxID=2583823 RepID=UPI00164F2184|nr:class I SAM-dependent methyltransferase [Salidesulfovibrio onnuriiensis]